MYLALSCYLCMYVCVCNISVSTLYKCFVSSLFMYDSLSHPLSLSHTNTHMHKEICIHLFEKKLHHFSICCIIILWTLLNLLLYSILIKIQEMLFLFIFRTAFYPVQTNFNFSVYCNSEYLMI